MMLENKVNTTLVDYAALNQLSKDLEKHFVPQTKLSIEQAFWSQISMNSSYPSPSCRPTNVEVSKELPKVSMLVLRAEVPVKMPSRRNRPLTEAYEQEFEKRIMERMKEQLGQLVDQLNDQMNDLMNNRRPHNLHCEDEDEESEENPFGDGSSSNEQLVERPRDTLNPEGFIDWLAAVEEVFEFKE
nr:hypothetical protein [Tanacetum cinerariifolium]